MDSATLQALALAVGLGLLVGLQREWAGPHVVGIRTLTLITLGGAVFGLLVPDAGPWLPIGGLLGVAAILTAGYLVRSKDSEVGQGLTTVVSALVMYGAGIAVGLGHTGLGVVVGGAVAVLLQWKRPMHAAVDKIRRPEIRAIMRLALIGLVLLPVLPDEDFGPFGVLNPFEIWLVVVLVCGMSLGGYLVYRFVGETKGMLIGGVLGGMISSTATTVSQARMARESPKSGRGAAVVIVIASAVVFVRVFVEVAVVAPQALAVFAPRLGAMAGLMALLGAVAWWRVRDGAEPIEPSDEPLQLKAALVFGALYAVVLLGVAFAKEHLGDGALYAVAALSGLTDLDAITLSTAQLVAREQLEPDQAWRVVLVGALANVVFKGGVVVALDRGAARRTVLVAFAIAIAGGAALLALS